MTQLIFLHIKLTCLCNLDPLDCSLYAMKLVYRGKVYFSEFALKYRLKVIISTLFNKEGVLTSNTTNCQFLQP